MSAIEQATGAQIYYHADVFTPSRNIAMAVIASVALTVLVVGILALLHANGTINLGPIGLISNRWTHLLLGAGGGLVFADIVLIMTLAIERQYTMEPMVEYINNEDAEWWTNNFTTVLAGDEPGYYLFEEVGNYGVLQVDKGARQIHLFLNLVSLKVYKEKLDGDGYKDKDP